VNLFILGLGLGLGSIPSSEYFVLSLSSHCGSLNNQKNKINHMYQLMEQGSNYIYILSIYICLYFVNFTFLLYKQTPFLLV